MVAARCDVHWRGKSFDSEEVEGALGLELMTALGLDARDPGAMDEFLAEVEVESFREDPMGTQPWRGEKDVEEGEDWEFHVGFHRTLTPGEREDAAEATLDAVGSHRSFHDATLLPDHDAVEPVEAEDDDAEDADGSSSGGGTWRNPALDDT